MQGHSSCAGAGAAPGTPGLQQPPQGDLAPALLQEGLASDKTCLVFLQLSIYLI